MTSLLKAIFGSGSQGGMGRSPSFDDLSMGAAQAGLMQCVYCLDAHAESVL